MRDATDIARCSACGRDVPRDDMFGAEPDLICEPCANRVRQRMAPSPTGRMVSAFAGGPKPVTTAVLVVAAFLFGAERIFAGAEWLWFLHPYGPTGNIGTGEAWRLVTSALLHGGWLHIIFNSIWVWSLGRATEGTRGSLGFLLIFVGSAAFSSAAQWYFRAEPYPIPQAPWLYAGAGVGLSGVLYALAGFLWMRRKTDPVAATVLNPQTAQILFIWFLACIFFIKGIANWAHGGGLVWGLLAGWISLQRAPVRYGGYVVLALVTIAAAAVVSTGHRLH